MRFLFPLCASLLVACNSSDPALPPPAAGVCSPGAPALVLTGNVARADAKTYRVIPFTVGAGTGRVELSYGWTENAGPPPNMFTATTLDLGLWDEKGYRQAAGFRGWGGSRQGRIDREQLPIFVEAAQADRGFVTGTIVPGVWYADLGIAAVSPQGASYQVKI